MEKKTKNFKLVVGLLFMVIILMGISFAWYKNVIQDSNVQYIKAKDLGDGKIRLIDCEDNLLLQNAIPISDKAGLAQENVCKVEIDNTENNVDLDFSVYLDDKELEEENQDKRMKDNFVRYSFVESEEEETVEKTKLLSTAGENPNRIIETNSINKGEKKTYYLKLWIDKDADNSVMGTIFYGKLRVDVGQKRTQKLIIDPNGGTYQGSSQKVSKVLNIGEEIEIEDAIYEGYTFKGWEISNNTTTIVDKKLTMGKGDTTISAIWDVSEDSVARINNTYYLTLEKALTSAVDGDEIVMIKNTTETVENTKNVTLNLNGYKVIGVNDKTIENSGNLSIIGTGTIENTTGVAISNTGTLTVGQNDETIDIENLKINGITAGIEQLGNMNFYDGVIEAKIGISGSVTEKPENNIVFVDHIEEKDYQKVYLTEKTTLAVAKQNEILYMNLQDAISTEELSQSGSTIYMIRDAELAYTLTVKTGKTVVIDINGNNITTGYTITNNGILTIKDGNTEKGILSPSVSITNNGILNIDSISITETTAANVIDNKNNLSIKNSTITGLDGYAITNSGMAINIDQNSIIKSNKYGLYNSSSETLNLNGGNIYGIYNNSGLSITGNTVVKDNNSDYCIYNNSGNLTIDSANLISTSTAIYNKTNLTINNINIEGKNGVYNTGTFTMNDGTINVTNSALNNSGTGELKGGTITTGSSTNSIYIGGYTGKLTIDGTNLTNTVGSTISIDGSVNIKINAGTIKAKVNGINACQGTFDISGGTIEAENKGINRTCGFGFGGTMSGGIIKAGTRGVEVSQGTFNFTGGIIEAEGDYALYTANNDGVTVNIGSNDGEVDKTSPMLIGNLYGLYIDSGTINFYDGILKGQTAGYYGTMSAVEDGCLIASGTDIINETTYNTNYLERMADFAQVGDQKFNSLQKAVDFIETEGKIEIIHEAIIKSEVVIPTTKNIEIDMAGYTITSSQPLTVQGTLTISDSSEEKTGTIKNDITKTLIVESKATATINNLNLVSSYGDYAILNSGTLTVSNINLKGLYGITNSGTFTMNDGTINVTNTAIYENKNSTLNGGTITTNSNNYSLNIASNGTTIISGTNIENTVGTVIRLGNGYNAGNIKINAGTIKTKVNGINACRGTFDISGGTIEAENKGINRTCGWSFGGTMSGGTIKAGTRGVEVSQGTFNFTGGIIEAEGDYALYTANNDGVTVNIGTNDGEVDKTSPMLIGNLYGLYIDSGTINFYDGILKGQTAGYYGTINSVEDGYLIASGTDIINEATYNTNYLERMADFAQVGDQKFNSLQKAVDSIETEGKIEIINDAIIKSEVAIPTTKNIEIDMAGYTITSSQPLTVQGTLTISDSSEEKTGTIKNDTTKTLIVESNAIATINNLNLVSSYGDYVISNSGTLTISNLNLSGLYGITNSRTFTMNDGNINTSNTALNDTGTSTLNGGTITTTSINNSIYAVSTGTLTIDGTNIINTAGPAVRIGSSRTGGTFKMISGNIKANTVGINAYRGNYEMSGGTVEGGTRGIEINSYTFNLIGGTVISTEYAVYNNSSTLNIGTNNGNVNNTNPVLIGSLYGLYNNEGTVNFYDGILKGKTDGYYGTINSLEDGYVITSGTETINEESYNTNYLSEETEIVQIGDDTYKNIQTAIDAANSGDTITLIDDGTIYYPLTVSSDDNINFDLAGHSLSTTKTITNEGTFTITDSIGNGNLTELAAVKMVTNNSNLTISNIRINNNFTTNDLITSNLNSTLDLKNTTINSLSGIYLKGTTNINNTKMNVSKDTVIENYGTLTIDDGNYVGTTSYNTVYHSNASGILKVSNANMTGSNTIYNYNTSETSLVNNIFNGTLDNRNTSTMNIDHCTINGYISNNSTSTVKILNNSSIDMSSKQYGIYNNTTGTIEISDSKIISKENTSNYYAVYNKTGIIDATNLTMTITNETNTTTRTNYGIYNNSTGTINLTNLNYISNDSLTKNTYRGIYNNSTGTINFNSGTITINGGKEGTGIYSQTENGNVNFLSGDISVTGTTTYGAYINNGNIILGTKDTNVSITSPTLKAVGTTSGIGAKKINGYLKFYDGKITGSTSAKPETTTEVEYGYEVHNYIDEDGYDYCILEYME